LVGDVFHDPVRKRGSIEGFREAPVIDRLGMRLVHELRRGVEGTREQVEITGMPTLAVMTSRSGA